VVLGMNKMNDTSMMLPITRQHRQWAQAFSREQPTTSKEKQVYCNTLAVAVTRDYLEMLGFATNLNNSNSWNPVLRLMSDTADLELTGLGRLECRSIMIGEVSCEVPPEVWEERIGYLVIELDLDNGQAKFIGFSKIAGEGTLSINQLRPLDILIDHLHSLMPISSKDETAESGTRLSRWFTGLIDGGWQQLDILLSSSPMEPAIAFRSNPNVSSQTLSTDLALEDRLKRAKILDLGIQLGAESVVLIVELQQVSLQRFQITFQVHSMDSPYLPAHLTLTVLDNSGGEFMQAEARNADNYIQLCFEGERGEVFRAQIALNQIQVEERFVI
jgi:hypothetical protein